jgi:hypothetical protein
MEGRWNGDWMALEPPPIYTNNPIFKMILNPHVEPSRERTMMSGFDHSVHH